MNKTMDEALLAHGAALGPEEVVHERETNMMGMWLFLCSEVMFFGAVIASYILYRNIYPQVWFDASRHLNVVIGSINTFVLLTSSFFVAMAVYSIQVSKPRRMVFFLILAILLGLTFIGLKGVEYTQEFRDNLFPGGTFIYPGPYARDAKLFFSFYFAMTGLHALHMIIGVVLLSIIAIMGARKHFTGGRYAQVEMIGLYWHFVDIVWIFLFPLLYLLGRS